MPWQGERSRHLAGTRREQRRANERILRRHGGICHVCGKPGATEVDHVIPLFEWPEGDVDSNKRPIHARPCHLRKTLAEAKRARARKSRRRPTDRHPGLA